MSKSKLNSITILLFILSSLAFFSNFSFNVNAGPNVPIANPNNGWHWGVDVGDELYYEVEFIVTNISTGEKNLMFRDIWIYNISSIENVTLDWLGVNDFSQINTTQYYYNLTADKLEPLGESSEYALFGYNDSDLITHKYRAGMSGMAFLLPLNGTNNLEVDILDDILNESFYYPAGLLAFNQYDYYESNPAENRIYFSNSTDGFFTEGYYYDNGTLRIGTAYLMASMGGGPVFINATMKRVFDYDITDEIEWGVNVGDYLYYDFFEGYDWIDDAEEVMLHITDISNILLEKSKNAFDESSIINMVYQAVYADIYTWNGTDYEIASSHEFVGLANNFYPSYFDTVGPLLTFIYPNTLTREDFEFMWNNDTLRIWEAPFDEISFSENGYFESFLKNSTGNDFGKVKVDKSTGLVESYLVYSDSYIMHYELKTQTIVDWSLNVGDSLYYKQNQDDPIDFRLLIRESHTVFVNMTELTKEYNSAGIPMVLPSSQPEYQYFSYLEGELEIWDTTTESWDYVHYGIFAVANIYWPISPLMFELGIIPLLIPENTVASELQDIFNMFSPVYDEITYSTNYVLLHNTTLDRTLSYYFDIPSGQLNMMSGWAKLPVSGTDWSYMSYYTKKNVTLSTGVNQFSLESNFNLDIQVDVELNVSVGAPNPEYIYSVLPFNPANSTLPNGTALVFFDQLITHYGLISGNITFTITFPSSIDLNQVELIFFAFNMSGTEQWDQPPPEFYDAIIYDYSTNSITFEVQPWGPQAILSAFAYIDLSQFPGIPAYDPILIFSFSILALIALITITRKRIIK